MSENVIILGHGPGPNGWDPGAKGWDGTYEADYLRKKILPALKKHLPKNANVSFVTDKNVYAYSSMGDYVGKVVTELHLDAFDSPTARSGHVIIHGDYEPDKLDLAIRDVVQKYVGVRYSHKGQKGISGRTDLRNPNLAKKHNINYRLVECAFISSKEDMSLLDKNLDAFCRDLINVILGSSNESAATTTGKSFLESIKAGAIRSWHEHKVLPSLVGAQAALESGWGQSGLAKNGKNLFGIKAGSDIPSTKKGKYPTKEFIDGKWIEVEAYFRHYDNWSESVADHGAFFTSTDFRKDNYKAVIGEKDYKKAVAAILQPIAKSSYATDPNYASKIIDIIEKNNLQAWDKEAFDNSIVPEKKPIPKPVEKPAPSKITGEVYTVKGGDTLSDIATRSGISLANLISWNSIKNANVINVGQVLKLKKPASPQATNTYTVKSGDTLSEIAAKYGMTTSQLSNLNGINNPNLINVGQVLKVSGSQKAVDKTYTVKSGDALSLIAHRLGVSVNHLTTKNGIKNANLIYPGQKLKY